MKQLTGNVLLKNYADMKAIKVKNSAAKSPYHLVTAKLCLWELMRVHEMCMMPAHLYRIDFPIALWQHITSF